MLIFFVYPGLHLTNFPCDISFKFIANGMIGSSVNAQSHAEEESGLKQEQLTFQLSTPETIVMGRFLFRSPVTIKAAQVMNVPMNFIPTHISIIF